MTSTQARTQLKRLLRRSPLAALATSGPGGPHASLVACAVTAGEKEILFVTPRETRKYRNLLSEPRVALLFGDGRGGEDPLRRGLAVTALGRARELRGAARKKMGVLLARRHPTLREFIEDAGSALFCVKVTAYSVVGRFQEVVEVRTRG